MELTSSEPGVSIPLLSSLPGRACRRRRRSVNASSALWSVPHRSSTVGRWDHRSLRRRGVRFHRTPGFITERNDSSRVRRAAHRDVLGHRYQGGSRLIPSPSARLIYVDGARVRPMSQVGFGGVHGVADGEGLAPCCGRVILNGPGSAEAPDLGNEDGVMSDEGVTRRQVGGTRGPRRSSPSGWCVRSGSRPVSVMVRCSGSPGNSGMESRRSQVDEPGRHLRRGAAGDDYGGHSVANAGS